MQPPSDVLQFQNVKAFTETVGDVIAAICCHSERLNRALQMMQRGNVHSHSKLMQVVRSVFIPSQKLLMMRRSTNSLLLARVMQQL